MTKKNRPNKAPVKAGAQPQPVAHGDCFRTFIDEARSIGNECMARREWDDDAVEFLKAKGLFEEWCAWRDKKRAPKP